LEGARLMRTRVTRGCMADRQVANGHLFEDLSFFYLQIKVAFQYTKKKRGEKTATKIY
jgi:hypothetical protein